MEIFSALLALCAGNSPVPVNSPHKGHWRGALMFYLICAWINWLSKQPWGWWFETPSWSLWRQCNDEYQNALELILFCGRQGSIFLHIQYHGCWWTGDVRNQYISHHHDDVIKWKHFAHYWPFVRRNHLSPVSSLHIGQRRGALTFSLTCAWINGCVNNLETGDLRHHRAHYNVTVMWFWPSNSGVIVQIQQTERGQC